MESKVILTGVLHTAKINSMEVIMSSDKLIQMVNVKLLCPTLVSVWVGAKAELGLTVENKSFV